MSGWIKIHRSITEHWLYTEKRMFSKFEAWNDILLTVNYSEAKCLIKGKLYIIKRGESILSLDNWAKRWGWDKSKVRRFIDLLKNDGMICLKTDNITTHLTVCKYETYQDIGNADETRTKHKRNSNEKQTKPIKEEEKELNNKKNIEDRKLKFSETLKPFLEIYGKDLLNSFYKYWTEPNKSNTKFKMELEETWSLERRLERWAKNEKDFTKQGNNFQTQPPPTKSRYNIHGK